MEQRATGHPRVSVGRTAELSALLFGTTELAHVLADVLDDAAGASATEMIDLRETAGATARARVVGA